jgi:hypothetical protein
MRHPPRALLSLVASLLLAMTASSCSSGGHSVSTDTSSPPVTTSTSVAAVTTTATSPPVTAPLCHRPPAPSVGIAWLPANLPMPPGSYLSFDNSTDSTHHRATIAAPVTAAAAATFITGTWTQQGWRLKAAPTATEPQRYGYSRTGSPTNGVVSFAALNCDPSWSQITLSLNH